MYFDENMNISEDKEQDTYKDNRVEMVDPCYYCLCNSCINNAESVTVSPDEVPYEWKPCFRCDECSLYDGKSHKNMEKTECSEYIIDNYHAEQRRKKIRIVR